MVSKDMKTWSEIIPLAPALTQGVDVIDCCIAFVDSNNKIDTKIINGNNNGIGENSNNNYDSEQVILIYKHEVVSAPLIAVSNSVSGNYSSLGAPVLLWENGIIFYSIL